MYLKKNDNPNNQEERRRTIKYGNNDVSKEYVDNALACGPLSCTLSGAGRKRTVQSTNASMPSDDAVEEMRDWSIECKV